MPIEKGSGSVVGRIYNASKELVFEGLTRFTYVHSEEVDDASMFTIETPDISLVDHKDLQQDKKLIVVWGYIPDTLRAHIVYIWDIAPTFTNTGLRLEIKAYCKAAYLKLNSSQKVFDETDLEEVVDDMAEQYGLTPETKGINPEEQTENPDKFENLYTGTPNSAVFDFKTQTLTVARDNTSYVKRYAFRKYKKDEAQPQANKSDKTMLDTLASQEPVDNLFINGRDEALIIQRRNLRQKPYKSYVLKAEPGYLLSFTPATRSSSAEKNSVAVVASAWDEETKEFKQAEITQDQASDGVIGKMIQQSFEQINRRKIEEENDNVFDRPISVGGMLQEEYDGVDASGNPKYKRVVVTKIDSTKRTFFEIHKRGTRPSQQVFPTPGKGAFISSALDAVGRIETRGFVVKEPKEYMHTVETDSGQMGGVAINRRSGNVLNRYLADLSVQGDVELESSRVIYVGGVGKKYSGNYYVFSVRHEITPEAGYICYIKMFRNGQDKNGGESANFESASELGLIENTAKPVQGDGTERLSQIPVREDR